MNEYVLLVMGTVVISTFLTAILPEGKTQNLIKGIAKLVCVLTMLSPIVQFFYQGMNSDIYKNLDVFFEESGIETSSDFITYYSELRIENATAQIEKELYAKFSLSVHVELEWSIEKADSYLFYDDEAIKISCIRIQMPSDVEKEVKNQVFQYVKDNYCSEVLIE